MSGNSNLALRRSKSSSNVPSNQKITKPFYQDLARDIKHFCSHACFIFLKSDRFSKFALLSIIDILQSPCVSKNPQCYKLLQNIFVDGGIFEKILKIRLTFGMGFTDVESMYIIILRAINLLTWKNKVAKHTFYVQLGYTRLHAYLTPYIINEENKMYSSVMLREFTNVLLFEGLIWGSDYKFDSSRALISNPLALNIILEMSHSATDDDQSMTLVAIHSMLEGEYGIENCSKCRCSAAYNYAVSSHYTIVKTEEIARNRNCMHPMPRFPCDDSAPTEGNTQMFSGQLTSSTRGVQKGRYTTS